MKRQKEHVLTTAGSSLCGQAFPRPACLPLTVVALRPGPGGAGHSHSPQVGLLPPCVWLQHITVVNVNVSCLSVILPFTTASNPDTHNSSNPDPDTSAEPDHTKAHRHSQPGGAQRPRGARAVCQDLQTEAHQTRLHSGGRSPRRQLPGVRLGGF